jgi:Ca2+-transporting ATPase
MDHAQRGPCTETIGQSELTPSAKPDIAGLSVDEAAKRLVEFGPNALPMDQQHLMQVLLKALGEPMFLLLLAAAGLYLILGDLHEALLLLFMVSVTIGLTLYQEGKTERALAALRDLSSPQALVVRGGQPTRVRASEVVPGDVLILSEGDRIAADAVLLTTTSLEADESLLTGESMPVRKRAAGAQDSVAGPGGDDQPFVWSGTLVVRGEGVARVTATGPASELGKIGGALRDLPLERSPLQRETARLIQVLALSGVGLSLVLAGVYGFLRGDWLQAVLVGIALAMALLPEEYPVILAVFPAIGAWRLSRVQVLTRRLSAIETLGSITVLCTDKTGTLTENRMRVAQMQVDGQCIGITADAAPALPGARKLARYAALASREHGFDPMEAAFLALAAQIGEALPGGVPIREYSLSPQLRAMSMVWPAAGEAAPIVAAKGAPEAIGRLCRFDAEQTLRMLAQVDAMAGQGLRVLAVAEAQAQAQAQAAGGELPATQDCFDFRFLGLLGLADPLRTEIPAAMDQCRQAGIRVLMITGDYPATAMTIARQAGMASDRTLSGEDIECMDDAQLARQLRDVSVCARITPAQKLRIVQALKANGGIVAMTGDGVNDATALKAAHVGIAMGGRGTDVAREAGAMVLLDDNFASIVRAIRLGRRICANMRNAMAYVLSIHVPIAGLAILPAIFGWPILLYPMQIAFLELIIDPACSIAFENQGSEADAMRRPPRDPQSPLFTWAGLSGAALQGTLALATVATYYVWALGHMAESAARSGAFVVLVLANLMLIFSHLAGQRSVLHAIGSINRISLVVAALAVATLAVTLYLPGVAAAFHFSGLALHELIVAAVVGVATLAAYEVVKRVTPAARA